MWGQGKRDGVPWLTWWNVIPHRWRESAPDAGSHPFGPVGSFAAAQVAERLQDAQWADQAHVPPLLDFGNLSGAPTPAPAEVFRDAAANRISPT